MNAIMITQLIFIINRLHGLFQQTSHALQASCLSPSSSLTKVSMVTGVSGVSTFLRSSWEGGGTRRCMPWILFYGRL